MEYIEGDPATIWRMARAWEAFNGFCAMPENMTPLTHEEAVELMYMAGVLKRK